MDCLMWQESQWLNKTDAQDIKLQGVLFMCLMKILITQMGRQGKYFVL